MIACLTVPYFAAAVERRDKAALAQRSLVVGGRPWEPGPLFGFSREAARQGVRPGMPLRQAHVLAPDANFLPAEMARYLSAAGEVIDALTDFTHLITPEELWQPMNGRQCQAGARTLPARYTVDLEELPQKEALPLTREMGRAVRRRAGLEPSIGLADDAFTAQVAAALTRPNYLRPVDAGAERSFLGERSLSFLPLEKETARRLRLLGVRTLGQLAALSPAAVREQFGAGLLPFYRLARGEGGAPASPPRPPSREEVVRHFEPPLANRLAIQNALQQMAADLAGKLAEAALVSGSLHLLVEMERNEPGRASLPLRRPLADARRLGQAAQEMAQTLAFEAGITALSLTAGDLQPAAGRQLSLFKQGATPAGPMAPAQAMARHPTAQFLRPVRVDAGHPLPERRFDWRPLGA